MSKLKDWRPGEFRVKIHLVTPKGSQLEYYLPHVQPDLGDKVIDLATKIVESHPMPVKAYPRIHGERTTYNGHPYPDKFQTLARWK